MRDLSRTLCLLLLPILWISALPARADDGLVMGILSSDSPKTLLTSWQPFFDDLSGELGIPVQGKMAEDYAGLIWYLAANKIQLAWVGNKAAIAAVDRANSEVIAQSLTTIGAGYYAHLIVRRDSGLNTLEDVLRRAPGLTFGNGDPNSTSGSVVPGYYIFATRQLRPDKIFNRVVHNRHEINFHSVASGRVDVATNNSSSLARYKRIFPQEYEKIKIIWTSPIIPSDPIVVRRDLNPELKRKILKFLVQYGRPCEGKSTARLQREQRMLEAIKWTGFKPSDNSQIIPIRKLELYKELLGVERNRDLPSAVRQSRINSITRKLDQLGRAPSAP